MRRRGDRADPRRRADPSSLSWRWCRCSVNVVFAAAALAGAVPPAPDQGPATEPRGAARRTRQPAGRQWPGCHRVRLQRGIHQRLGQRADHPASSPASASSCWAPSPWSSAEVTHPLVPLYIIVTDRTRGTAYLGAVIAGIGLIGLRFLLVTYTTYRACWGSRRCRPVNWPHLPFVAGIVARGQLRREQHRAAAVRAQGSRSRGAWSWSWPPERQACSPASAAAGGSYGTHVAPALVLHEGVEEVLGCGRDVGLQPRPGRHPSRRHRSGGRHGEHQQPGRRLARCRPAQHDRGYRGRMSYTMLPGTLRTPARWPLQACTAISPPSPPS